jgi:hypothetical protein
MSEFWLSAHGWQGWANPQAWYLLAMIRSQKLEEDFDI